MKFPRDICAEGESAVNPEFAAVLFQLFAAFSSWAPIVPRKPKDLAEFLAPYCRLVRGEVEEALINPRSPLQSLKKEIKTLLFPEATDRQFADAYAQTVIFALLLAKLEGADVLDLSDAYLVLESRHLLLSRSLQFLTDPQARVEISSSLGLTQRVIQEILPETLKSESSGDDPWLFFYEFFLAKYDPQLRKEWGVYYTPVEVVRCQVALIDEILSRELGRTMGFVEPGVVTLDPGLGTGTYLLGIIDHSLRRVEEEEGRGAVRGGARSLAGNLHGFEWMVGPYAVAQLRFSRVVMAHGAALPPGGAGIYLTNTLESPHTHPLDMLSREFGNQVTAEDLAGYVYAALAQPEYTERFSRELGSREIRVPLTRKAALFFKAAEFGKTLLWLLTYGERLEGEGRPHGHVPPGRAKCLKAVPDDEDRYPNEFRYDEESGKLHVGEGSFGPVNPAVYRFEVSGFQVVKSWLGYRMRERSGKKSSPLDDIRPRVWTREFTRELLELLWVLEKTVEGYPMQKKLLEDILQGPHFNASELPPVPDSARQAPVVSRRDAKKQGEISFD